MPSELDREMQAVLAAHTAPGGLLETASIERFGVALPVFADAPPSLPAFYARFCASHAGSEFLADGELRLTFAEVHEAAAALARRLAEHAGVGPGTRVGIAARNSAAWVIAFIGVTIAGACAVLLNGWWTGEELVAGIALADCELVLADPARAARLERLLPARCPDTRLVTFLHAGPDTAFAALGEATAATPLPLPGPDDPATILFTSGSTGGPKGAVSDHRAVIHATLSFLAQTLVGMEISLRRGMALPAQQSSLVAIPLFHVTGLVALLLQSIAMGRRLVLMDKWDPAEAMRRIEAERISYFVGVPLMSHEIATHPDRAAYDLASCTYFAAGGAARPVAHVETLRASLPHAWPLLGYGLTETNAVGATNFRENYLAKPDSTGPASTPLVEIAILDPEGRRLPAGEAGEIAIRSVCNMTGYWRDPQATAAAFTADGFFLTGDIGRMDEDGYLFVVDRKKDIVIRGGENVSCLEVEQALYAHPGIAEVAVFAAPDARFGEVPAAAFVAKPGHDPDEAELREFLARRIAPFKIPSHFFPCAGLPRLGSGKLDKRAIKACHAPIDRHSHELGHEPGRKPT